MRRHLPGSFWVPFCGKKVQNTRDIVAAFSVLLMATDARSTSRDRLRAMPCQKEENERSEVKSTKTIRMSLLREQPPAHVERAQQEQDFTAQKHAPFRLWRLGKQHAVCPRLRTPLPASRSGHAGCRLFSFRCKRECGGLKPLPGAIVGFCASCLSRTHPSRRGTRRTIPARCRSCETKSRLKVARNGAGLLANPRIGARFER